LADAEKELFLPQFEYNLLDNEKAKTDYVKISRDHLLMLGGHVTGTETLLQKQLGVIAIALLREKVGGIEKKFMIGGNRATVTSTAATAVSKYEKVVCKFYRFVDYLEKPLSKNDLLSVVT
jgi:hypothetical protein